MFGLAGIVMLVFAAVVVDYYFYEQWFDKEWKKWEDEDDDEYRIY